MSSRPSGTEPATGVEVNHDEATRIAGGWCSLVLKPNAHPHDKAVQVLARAYLALRSSPPTATSGGEFGELLDEYVQALFAGSLTKVHEIGDRLTAKYEQARKDCDLLRRAISDDTDIIVNLQAKYEEVVSERDEARDAFRGIEIEAGMPEGGDILEHIHALRADALTPEEARECLRHPGEKPQLTPAELTALDNKLARIASRLTATGEER